MVYVSLTQEHMMRAFRPPCIKFIYLYFLSVRGYAYLFVMVILMSDVFIFTLSYSLTNLHYTTCPCNIT